MSQIYLSLLIILITNGARVLGLDFDQGQITELAGLLISVGVAVYAMFKRWQQGDITPLGGYRQEVPLGGRKG
jgi:hypothetical protein